MHPADGTSATLRKPRLEYLTTLYRKRVKAASMRDCICYPYRPAGRHAAREPHSDIFCRNGSLAVFTFSSRGAVTVVRTGLRSED